MNYGFENELKLNLDKSDEQNSLFIQLYHKVLSKVSVENKFILEVGSGRGGGAAYIAKYLKPKKLIGIDFSKNAVTLCNKIHKFDNLEFQVGDSENIPFENNTFEVVYNVESSHCYPSRRNFINEVFRVLKTGGYFCWADLCNDSEWSDVNKFINEAKFKILHSENITENVILALDLISDRKVKSIDTNVPKIIRKTFRDFAGVKETKVYNAFKSGQLQYYFIVAQK